MRPQRADVACRRQAFLRRAAPTARCSLHADEPPVHHLEQVAGPDPAAGPHPRQDVSRSPGGDSRLFLNNCIACHSGMDPMTQAFAYYDYDETAGACSTRQASCGRSTQQQGHVPGGLLHARRHLGQLLAQGQ